MGRKSNAKWTIRIQTYRAMRHIAEKLHFGRLFGRHRKFNP